MKKAKFLLIATLVASLAVSLLALTACGSGGSGAGGGGTAVAATVNGTEILEGDVTAKIVTMQAQTGSSDNPTVWAQTLADAGLTPSSLRDSVINSMARDIIIKQEAEAQGLTVDEAEIDAQIEEAKATVGAEDDAAWLAALKQFGYADEQAYRDMLSIGSLTNQLNAAFVLEPTNEELLEFIVQNPNSVADFTLPALEGSEDGEEGMDPASLTAQDIDLGAIPSDVLGEFIRLWEGTNRDAAFQGWLTALVEEASIVINPMPEGLPYDVEMPQGESAEAAEGEAAGAEENPSSPGAIAAAIAEGLVITDDVVGDGDEAVAGSVVHVFYVGTFEDGTEFDNNTGEGATPFAVTLGSGQVIRGWDAGLVGMKVGGTRTLEIPASLAYGEDGHGDIPGGATLTFVVELVEVS